MSITSRIALWLALALCAAPALADGIDNPGGGSGSASITIGTTTITGGADKQILFNDAGTVGSDADFTWNKTTNVLTVLGTGIFNLNAAAAPTGATGTGLQIVGTDATVGRYECDSFAAICAFTARRANGTGASPTALTTNDQIGSFNFHGYYVTGGPAYSGVQASVQAFATQAWTSTALGTQIKIATTPNGSTTLTTALTIDQDQSVAAAAAFRGLTGAFGGCTIGSNALCVTGTSLFNNNITLGVSATLITNSAAGILSFNNGTTNALSFGFLPGSGSSVSGAQVNTTGAFGWSAAGGSTNNGDTFLSRNAAGVVQFGTSPSSLNAAGAWLAAKGTLTGGTLADQAQVEIVTATNPASPTGTQIAISETITGAGSASQANFGRSTVYAAGYTGSSFNAAARFVNLNAGALSSAVLVSLGTGFPSTNAALNVDNAGVATNIFIANDNGSPVFTIADGGAVTSTSTIKTGGFTVAGLPAAGTAGRRAYVTDQTTACVATGAALTGGGAVVCPVFDNGSAWVGG